MENNVEGVPVSKKPEKRASWPQRIAKFLANPEFPRIERATRNLEALNEQIDKEWAPHQLERADRWGIIQMVAIYRKLSLGVAELPTTDKVHQGFLDEFAEILPREIEHLSPEKKSRRVRWITATVIDEFLTQAQKIKKEERLKQFLLTARQVFFAGIRQSEQFAPGKIDPLWTHEIQGKITSQIANPGVELTPLRNQLKSFVDNPPLLLPRKP